MKSENQKIPHTLAILANFANERLKHHLITRSDVEAKHPKNLDIHGQQVRISDVLNQAMDATGDDPGDWPDLLNLDCLTAFADTLLIDGLIQCRKKTKFPIKTNT